MPEYQATYYNPGNMPDNCHMGDPIGAPSPIKAAIEYLMLMSGCDGVDDDPITEVYVYEIGVEPRHIYGYKIPDGLEPPEPMEGEFPPPGRCPETLDIFG